jgi:hypothetical protein
MKKYSFIFLTIFIPLLSCKKDHSLTEAEKRLIGDWNLIQKVIEEPGQPTITIPGSSLTGNCFIKFFAQSYGFVWI